MPKYSFVIPVHNEQEMLHHLFDALDDLSGDLDGSCEFVMVDDGSRDASWPILTERARRDPRCRLVRLSRNFGHQIAVTAGLDHADGDAVVIMDADLQDPPQVVLEMAQRWRDGYQVVYGQRTDRDDDTWFKRTTAGGYYRLLNRLSTVDIPSQVGDFRLIDRVVVDAIRQMPEHNRYMRGMFSWLGFSQIAVTYSRPARLAGTTSYSLRKMLSLAGDGVIGYSKLPLRAVLATGAAAIAAGGAVLTAASATSLATGRGRTLIGPAWRVVAVGAQLAAVGIVGEYVGRVLDETIDRPLYVVREVVGDQARATSADRDDTRLHALFGSRQHLEHVAPDAVRMAGPRS